MKNFAVRYESASEGTAILKFAGVRNVGASSSSKYIIFKNYRPYEFSRTTKGLEEVSFLRLYQMSLTNKRITKK